MRLQRIAPTSSFGRAKFKLLDKEKIGKFTVESGFVTDGLTLPWFVRAFYDPLGHGFRAAVLHDYLLAVDPNDRKKAAHEFREECKRSQAHPVIRQLFYWFIRIYDRIVSI